MFRLSVETIETIKKEFESGISCSKLAWKYDVDRHTIYRYLGRKKYPSAIKRDQKRKSIYLLTETETNGIVSDYVNGMSGVQIQDKYNIGQWTIYRMLKRNGVKLRPASGHRIYQLDESYFEIINTEEKAYDFGWICADGGVDKYPTYCLQIGIAQKDKHMLVEFLNRIKSNYKIRDFFGKDKSGNKNVPKSSICIYSKKMVLDLEAKGCCNVYNESIKTYNLKWPTSDIVPPHLMIHFFRGYSDGDGSFYLNKNDRIGFDFLSCYDFCEGALNWLNKEFKIHKTKICFSKNINNVKYGGRRQVSQIWHILYDNATIWLPRKKDSIKDHLSSLEDIAKGKHNHRFTKEQKQNIISEYLNLIKTIKPETIIKPHTISGAACVILMGKYNISSGRIRELVRNPKLCD